MRMGATRQVLLVLFVCLAGLLGDARAGDYERRNATFRSQGVDCEAWYYVPAGLKPGEKRPAIVMAHGFTGVKEMALDNFASRFAQAGLAVVVFDYRYFGASGGEPRGQVLWTAQIDDYRNAISWASLQPEVDPERIGVWGTSMSGGNVLYLAAFDRRIKAVVAQVPLTNVWSTYMAKWPAEQQAGFLSWLAQARTERVKSGRIAEIAVAAPVDQPSFWPLQEWHDGFSVLARNAPAWRNSLVVESLETHMLFEPVTNIRRISPTPLLMIVATDDVITPTAEARAAYEEAGEPKKLVMVQGRHFDAYEGPKHEAFVAPAVDWFRRWLNR